MSYPKSNTLHIHSQGGPHEDAVIVGDEKALRLLASAIQRAIESGLDGSASFCADGEGFICYVVKRDDLEDLKLPYTDEPYKDCGGEIHPLTTISKERYKEIFDKGFGE